MLPGFSSTFQMPSFLHGTFANVSRRAHQEGRRCGEQYRKDGSFPPSREMLEVPVGEVIIAHEVADLHRERQAWRLYMVSGVLQGIHEAMDFQDIFPVRDAFEEFCRETPWGALHFIVEQNAPRSAVRTSRCLKALLRFWEPLQSARYLFKKLDAALTLEELMSTACDWVMDAWCPVGEAAVRVRLEDAAERMARATREDSIEAILREMPRALAYARNLKHRDVVSSPILLRERLTALAPGAFERVAGACTSDLLGLLYAWDRQLEKS